MIVGFKTHHRFLGNRLLQKFGSKIKSVSNYFITSTHTYLFLLDAILSLHDFFDEIHFFRQTEH
ncbi:Putative protein [Zobellia galactanivorans]|uniref:Uncharacterized protein n=1 Tax=Zobellia galactanivorans (strain DSM 12802 / CCUG 47099 / CIP 106680 / NCIMB 13871 / Dsij) TaxID=63186 RepID=G0L511_ZOBGA|nr:Putative protein [Zobellia galactanivorans]